MKRIIPFLVLFVLLASACNREEGDGVGTVEGYRPIYMSVDDALSVEVKGPEDLSKPGKIFVVGSWLYLTDKGKGVHFYDISNLLAPKRHAFISIPGIQDVAVKGNYLYADNITDIVVFDIADLDNISLSQRIEDVYPATNQQFPSSVSGYFECYDQTKGYVVGWEKTNLVNPKCRRD